MRPASRTESGLQREIGIRRLAASIVNSTIGAGIFVLPATVAAGLGPAAPFAYVVCASVLARVVPCFAAAGSRVSLTGGLYVYIEVAFGRFVGYLAGVLYWVAAMTAVASVAAAFADSLALALPVVATSAARAIVLTLLFGGLGFVNV